MMLLVILIQNRFLVKRIASVVQDNINAYRLAGRVEENFEDIQFTSSQDTDSTTTRFTVKPVDMVGIWGKHFNIT